mgnify:CR=1 FL=1
MRWGSFVYAALSTSSVALRRQLPLIGEASGVSGKLHKGRCTAANLQVRHSIFFCFSKRKRWRVRNDHGGTSRRKRRLLSSVLISSFPNRELNLRFGFYRKSAATSQALRASIPTPFVPSGHFPLIGGIGPWKGSLFLQLFPLLPAENHPGGRRGRKTGRPVRTSARSTCTFCTPQNKKRETVHIAAGSALVGGYFV